MRSRAGSESEPVAANLLRVIALAGRMQIVPAHDGRAYTDIPRLATGAGDSL
jgi:hypothetical protein